MKTIEDKNTAEIVIKKSKFIANIFRVDSEDEAKNVLNEVSKKYFDAKHNCYAYRICEIESLEQNNDYKLKNYKYNVKEKFSDNGEPQGTAGSPILEIIKRNDLYNVIIVVTRYFGGILLGTGGLTRAYSEATKEAVENCKEIEKNFGDLFEIECSYENQKDVIYELKNADIKITKQEYAESVKLQIEVPKEKEEELNNLITRIREQNKIEVNLRKVKENVLI